MALSLTFLYTSAYVQKARNHYEAEEYAKAIEAANEASELFIRLKDNQSLNEAGRIINSSNLLLSSLKQLNQAEMLCSRKKFSMCRELANKSLQVFTQLNDTEDAKKAEDIIESVGKRILADEVPVL